MVVAAGNSGSGCSTVSDPPSFYAASYTVGALNTGTDTIAGFSSRGPVTRDGSNRTKPDITAPGTNTRSCDNTCDSCYTIASGTSMATPHIAGAMALLWSAIPSLQHQIQASRDALDNSAVFISSTACGAAGPPNNVYGWGRVNIATAVGTPPPTPVPDPTPPTTATPCGADNANANAYRNDSSKSNTYAKLAWVTYAYTHTGTFSYAYCYDTTVTDAYALNTRIAYSDANDHTDAQGNTKASADSASSAVMSD